MTIDELDYEAAERQADELSDNMTSDLIDMFIKDDRQHILSTVQMAIASQMFDAVNLQMIDMMEKLNISESDQADIGNIVNCMISFSNVCAVYSALQKIRLTSNDTNG
jgi:hypothetical protein